MQLLDRTLDDPRANLALDEALLEEAEQQGSHAELLRLWEFQQPVVVVGRSSRLADEIHLAACQQDQVAVLVIERAGERMQVTGDDRFFGR